MGLPVIQTCGDCSHSGPANGAPDAEILCDHKDANAAETRYDIAPPDWCPLRTADPDAFVRKAGR